MRNKNPALELAKNIFFCIKLIATVLVASLTWRQVFEKYKDLIFYVGVIRFFERLCRSLVLEYDYIPKYIKLISPQMNRKCLSELYVSVKSMFSFFRYVDFDIR